LPPMVAAWLGNILVSLLALTRIAWVLLPEHFGKYMTKLKR